MASISIRDLDDALKAGLRVRAARNGRSMEAEVRAILRDSLAEDDGRGGLGSRIHERFAAVGGAELGLSRRTDPPRAAEFPQ